jgi:hypothetical protein
VKWLLALVAFLLGGGLTWVLTVHRVTRVLPDTSGEAAVGGDEAHEAGEAAEDEDGSAFGGPSSEESSGEAGARWMPDAEDEDALLRRAAHRDDPAGRPPGPPGEAAAGGAGTRPSA